MRVAFLSALSLLALMVPVRVRASLSLNTATDIKPFTDASPWQPHDLIPLYILSEPKAGIEDDQRVSITARHHNLTQIAYRIVRNATLQPTNIRNPKNPSASIFYVSSWELPRDVPSGQYSVEVQYWQTNKESKKKVLAKETQMVQINNDSPNQAKSVNGGERVVSAQAFLLSVIAGTLALM
jgi:hypothetical protein